MKLKNHFLFTILAFLSTLLFLSCSNDKPLDNGSDDLEKKHKIVTGDTGIAEYFNYDLVSEGYMLVNDAQSNRVYLMDKNAKLIHEWPLNGKRLGNDAFLMKNGLLLAMLEAEDPKIELGGFGGLLQLIDKNGDVTWSFDYSTNDYIMHHDAEMLPNGNIIVQIWERIDQEEVLQNGSYIESDFFPDAIIEINPSTDEIVWEWHVWDHLIQDLDNTKENYGVISENPQLVDLNYVSDENGDIMHANGLDYDSKNDLIFLSVNFYSEIWVIDHSTTTTEASMHTGGNYNKGGDLIYRFGNPSAYDNSEGQSLFDHNHRPNLLKGVDEGNILVFSNGFSVGQSTAYELKLPDVFSLQPNEDNEPTVIWSFTDTELFSPKVSSAERLPNGNTLITEGDFGIWEVTNSGEIVWKFEGEGFFWRTYYYDENASEILSLGF